MLFVSGTLSQPGSFKLQASLHDAWVRYLTWSQIVSCANVSKELMHTILDSGMQL